MKKIILMALLLAATAAMQAKTPEKIPLYDGKVPNSRTTLAKPEKIVMSGSDTVYKPVAHPTLTICLPDTPNAGRTAIVICPGGGYFQTSYTFEGLRYAEELNKHGIAAFVLNYRMPSDANQPDKKFAPLQDAQRAIQVVREHASQYGINPHHIGIMGFSAGGHLASTAGTHYAKAYIDNPLGTSLRPDFMVLAYPVVSFDKQYGHVGSCENLLGKNPSKKWIDFFSNNLQVTPDTPPTFLAQCTDDRTVSVMNSVILYEALHKQNVPAEMHIYVKGDHCFRPTPSLDEWLGRLYGWLDLMGFSK